MRGSALIVAAGAALTGMLGGGGLSGAMAQQAGGPPGGAGAAPGVQGPPGQAPISVRPVAPGELPEALRNPPKDIIERLERLRRQSFDAYKQAQDREAKGLGPGGKPLGALPLKFEARVKDFGRFPDSAEAKLEWTFTNVSAAPVKILQLKSNLGAIVPRDDKAVIEPGKQGSIVATFNPSGRVGQEYREVEVLTDHAEAARFTVGALVDTIAKVMVDPPRLVVGKVRKGERCAREFGVYGRQADFKVEDFKFASEAPKYAIRKVREDQVKFDDGSMVNRALFEAELIGKPGIGLYDDQLEILTNDSEHAKLPFALSGEVLGDLAVAPTRVRIGGITLKPGDPFQRAIKVTHRDATAFGVSAIRIEGLSEPWRVVVDLQTLDGTVANNPEAGYLIKLSGIMPASGAEIPAGAKVVFETTIADQARIEVPVVSGGANPNARN